MSKVTGRFTFSLAAALGFCLFLAPRAFALDEPVRVESGLLTGVAGTDPDVRVFKGVPYAAPPIGALRWRPPQPVKAWTGVRAATAFGPSCPQPTDGSMAFVGIKQGPMSEDCLYLNVWTAAKKPSDKLPVMVWIHGGGFMNGSGAIPFYNGEKLAKQGVVVVTINYRLGAFGFFAHPLLSKESPHNSSGNYGLLDQIAALRWVQKNIGAFGGDSSRVTLFGESAGGISVCYLMASPLAKGLFQRAIAESGSAFSETQPLRSKENPQKSLENMGERIARTMVGDQEKDVLAALRAKSSDEILQGMKMPTESLAILQNSLRFWPVVDGWVIPKSPVSIYAASRQQAIPLIVGTNADEGTIFTLQMPRVDAAQYRAAVQERYGADADAVLSRYPAPEDSDVKSVVSRLMRDTFFVTGARYFAETQSKVSKAYLYEYTYKSANPRFASLGAFHGSEIPAVFGTMSVVPGAADEAGRQLSQTMMATWARFAATGDPNGGDLPAWPHYETSNDSHLEFGREISVKTGLHKDSVDLFERIMMEPQTKRTAK